MSKRLGKDQRAKFLAEYEQDGKLSDPNFYVKKTKNGKIQIRKVKPKKESSSEETDPVKEVKPVEEEKPVEEKPKKEKTL